MKRFLRNSTYLFLCLLASYHIMACKYFQKKVPPTELFAQAEQLRKDDRLMEAAEGYDTLVSQHPDSELVPPALYYSGICKYSLGGRAVGPKTLKERADGLSEGKKTLYEQWIDYMKDHKNTFSYVEGIDQFLYKGNEFKTLIEKHPSSNLVDDAAFQLIRLHIRAKQSTNTFSLEYAIQLYTDYFTAYSQSPYRQKGLEHLSELFEEQEGAILHYENISTAFKEFSGVAKDLPGLRTLAYDLANTFLAGNEQAHAASILGVPSVIGFGTVETERTRLNIRSGPGTNTRIATKADKGDRVLLLSRSDDWYQILLPDGTLGYAHRDFIREN